MEGAYQVMMVVSERVLKCWSILGHEVVKHTSTTRDLQLSIVNPHVHVAFLQLIDSTQ